MKNKILILGGTGAMGKFLVQILSDSNEWDIYITSRSKYNIKKENINYINGNARDYTFIKNICTDKYDVIVDFMNYDLDEFKNNYSILLNSCNHYIFLSSCRVYNNDSILSEDSNRLLDITNDKEFLKTQRYALRKARQEDILEQSQKKNWTIVRPYITYSNMRLQLGIYEKEEWLYRILNNKELAIRKEILAKNTTMTYGYDVATGIYRILNNEKLFREKIQIVTNEYIKWEKVLEIYLDVLKNKLDIEPKIYQVNELPEIESIFEGGYNTIYDRLWDRKFNNDKVNSYCGKIQYTKIEEGLRKCLIEFINLWKEQGNTLFKDINNEYEQKMDSLCKKIKSK